MPRFYGAGEAVGAAVKTAGGAAGTAAQIASGNVAMAAVGGVLAAGQAGAELATAREQARAMAAQGKSAVEIAKATGISEREQATLGLASDRERRASEKKIADLVLPALVGLTVLVVAGSLIFDAIGDTDEEEE